MPAARLLNITSIISPAPEAKIPIVIPKGVDIEKVKISHLTIEKSLGKALTKLMPRAEAAAPLWMKIASIIDSAD